MSSSSQSTAPSSIFKSMLDTALAEYQKKTGDDLLAHWLVAELQTCESVDGVLDILRDQAKAFEQSGDQKMMKWIDPLVHVLYTFSGALGDGVSLAFPPAKVIFTGIGVLLAAAKDVRASHGAIIDLFERIESFFKRLEVYTEISLSTKMAEVLVKIVIELLSILSIATKEVKRRRAKLYFKKLLGRTDIEDALKKLDSLIQEEFQMVTAQILKVTTEAKDDADKVNVVMQQNMEEVKRDVLEVKRKVVEVKCDVEEVKWTQIEQDIHKWLSPPDPSTNYNIACETHQEGTAAWFFRGKKFKNWTSIGSLLWIHGKPGSGKSILCSAIIKYVMSLRDAGQAVLAFFYFDFRDKDKKQDFRNFVTSLLVQLSAYSTRCCEIIFRFYSTHGKGTREPSKDALTDCLREMLSIVAQQPVYIIVDALDECPNASGIPTPREAVLDLLKDLVRLGLPELHICITSRPEFDIKRVLEPLPHGTVSLHDEDGQKKDISNYVTGVVYADRDMRSWRDEDKMLVVNELSNRADGMFRWVFCQLEVLRHCFPANIRQTLRELPESLDETYARVLMEIKKTNQGHAHRMLQCLMVAVRPLHVEELAELLAFEFDGAQGGIPKYRSAWRLGDQTQAVLSTCSSLITIVSARWSGRQVVQFSHFSVKEFLISDRLTSPLGNFSRYRILPGPAHTILTQACLGFLLHLDEHIDKEIAKGFPLAKYAARHWVEHAQFEDVALRVMDGMRTLFDPEKPYFLAWIGIYDVEYKPLETYSGGIPNPLYYSVLWGFYDLVKHLAIKHPQHVNTLCGQYKFPLLAALGEGHIEVAELLLEHGANVNVRDTTGKTILLKVLLLPLRDLASKVKFLLKHGADVNARDDTLTTSLHLAEDIGNLEVAQLLIEHKADVNSHNNNGKTPLHILLKRWVYNEDHVNHARLLLEHGAEANKRDKNNKTPLHLAAGRDLLKLTRILLEHGADTNAMNNHGKTPLHLLLSDSWIGYESSQESSVLNHAHLLLKHGAEVSRRDKDNQTPLHLVVGRGWFKLARFLLEHGADVKAEENNGKTPLHILSESRINAEGDVLNHALLLLKFGAEVNKLDKDNQTPLHLAMGRGRSHTARILLEHGADIEAEDDNGKTPLHTLSESRINDEGDVLCLAPLLLELGAEVNRRDKDNRTPLHLAMGRDQCRLTLFLLRHGADAEAKDNNGKTPLHTLSESRINDEGDPLNHARLLLEHGAEVNRRDNNNETPLLLATRRDRCKLVRFLLENGADANAEYDNGKTLLHILSERPIYNENYVINHAHLLLEYGAEVNRRNNNNQTSLLLAMGQNQFKLARVLLEHGADPNAKDNDDKTPLHVLSENHIYDSDCEGDVLDIILLLLEHGAVANSRDKNNQTPLLLAIGQDQFKLARILLEHGADAIVENNNGKTPLHILSETRIRNESDALDLAWSLLENGAVANRRDKNNQTPLLLTMGRNWLKLAWILLEHGADPNAENNGKTPLHILLERHIYDKSDIYRDDDLIARPWPQHDAAVDRRYTDSLLLEIDASVENKTSEISARQVSRSQYGSGELLLERSVNIDAQATNHMTLSQLQSKTFSPVQIARALLDHGANVNSGNNGGDTSLFQESEGAHKYRPTLLHLASLYGRPDIARVLLEHGVTANLEDKFGRTPLHLLAVGKYNFEQDRIRIAQLLLECGADVNAQDNDNVTPLHLASYDGRVAIARALLDHGAAADSKGNQGRTPLHLVAESRHLHAEDYGIRVAQLLLERGADVDVPDEDNRTPLHLASYNGRVEVARVLLDGGATANPKDNQGRTPLHAVAEGGDYTSRDNDTAVAQLLLESGAGVNMRDDDNQTPLHSASYFGKVEMVLVLLNSGANANAKDARGRTSLHLASQCPSSRCDIVGVVRLLLEYGADVNAQDQTHATPLDLASYYGRTEVASLFLRHRDSDKANIKIDQGPIPNHLGLEGVRFHDGHWPPKHI